MAPPFFRDWALQQSPDKLGDGLAVHGQVQVLAVVVARRNQADQLPVHIQKGAAAAAVGKLIAERAKAKGIETVVFDRGGYVYHGRVKALAEGAREGGLQF